MTITLLTLLLISNALSLRTDKSILFSRVVMVSLIHTSFLAYNNLFFLSLDKGIGIFGGLFHVTVFTQAFNIFIFILTGIILTLTSFYPIKAILKQISSFTRVIFIFLSLIIVSWIVGFTHLFPSDLLINKLSFIFYIFFNALAFKIKFKPKIANKIAGQYRILEYSLLIVFGLFLTVIFTSIVSITCFLCLVSNFFLFYSLSISSLKLPKRSIKDRIKSIFIISKKELLNSVVRLFITSCLVLIVKLVAFYSFNEIGYILFVYLYIVIYPLASFIRTSVSLGFLLRDDILDIPFTRVFIIIWIETTKSITVKNFFIYMVLVLCFKLLFIGAFIVWNLNLQFCDSADDNLNWINKEIVIGEQSHSIYLLPEYQINFLDNLNLVPHVNLKQMLESVEKLKLTIKKLDYPGTILNSSHFNSFVKPGVKVMDYFDIKGGELASDSKVQNFDQYIMVPLLKTIEHGIVGQDNVELPDVGEKEEFFILSNGMLKHLLGIHNHHRLNNVCRPIMARSLLLDYKTRQVNIHNIIQPCVHMEMIKELNDKYLGLKSEYSFLIQALSDYKTGNTRIGSNFRFFQLRQISYHMDMIQNLLSGTKLGISLNRNFNIVNGKPVKNLFSLAQHKLIIGALDFKFLIPDHNDNSFLIKDFTNEKQVYQELVENILYVQLNYILSYKQLNYINGSKHFCALLDGTNLTKTERNSLLQQGNLGLKRITKSHIKVYDQSYKLIKQYQIFRILNQTNKSCYPDLFNYVTEPRDNAVTMDLEMGVNVARTESKILSKVGFNLAQEFAYSSPFSRFIHPSVGINKPYITNTYSHIGVMAKCYIPLD